MKKWMKLLKIKWEGFRNYNLGEKLGFGIKNKVKCLGMRIWVKILGYY